MNDLTFEPQPIGRKIGTVDEYGSVWDGEPGTTGSTVIGDLVPRDDEETYDLYLREQTN